MLNKIEAMNLLGLPQPTPTTPQIDIDMARAIYAIDLGGVTDPIKDYIFNNTTGNISIAADPADPSFVYIATDGICPIGIVL